MCRRRLPRFGGPQQTAAEDSLRRMCRASALGLLRRCARAQDESPAVIMNNPSWGFLLLRLLQEDLHQRRARLSRRATYDSRDTDQAKRVRSVKAALGWGPQRGSRHRRAEDAFFRATSSGVRLEGRARRDGDWLLRQAETHEVASQRAVTTETSTIDYASGRRTPEAVRDGDAETSVRGKAPREDQVDLRGVHVSQR